MDFYEALSQVIELLQGEKREGIERKKTVHAHPSFKLYSLAPCDKTSTHNMTNYGCRCGLAGV